MSTAVNFNDAIAQLGQSLDISGKFRTNTVKPVRCSWLEDPKRNSKGWFMIYETVLGDGNLYLTGAYGWWIGDERNAHKIDITGDYKPNKEDQALMRKQMADARKKADAERKRAQDRARAEATKKWRALSLTGDSGYEKRKLIETCPDSPAKYTADGAMAIPMTGVDGRIYGIQFILDKDNPDHKEKIKRMDGNDKRFWPYGTAMQGNFCMVGIPHGTGVLLICEGYATAASLHLASGLPVAVAFNAHNILPVLKKLAKQFPKMKMLICADDDYLCRCQHCKKQTEVDDGS